MATLHSGGRTGLVLDARAVGPERDGQQLVSVRLKATDGLDSNGFDASANASTVPSEANRGGQPVPVPRAARLRVELSPAEKEEVARLQQRDAQVRQEENAHAGNAGDLAGPISYVYQTGPDGRRYAVGGSVSIQASSASGDPGELRRIGARLHAAANAAVSPSAQDLAAARTGLRLYAQAADSGQPRRDLDLSA